MSNEKYGDSDLVYWMGRSINAMIREELQTALGEAMMQIERHKNNYWQLYKEVLRLKAEVISAHNSRSASIELRTSCC